MEPLFQRALQIDMKALGPVHPDTATSLDNLSLLKFVLGQMLEAKSFEQISAKAHLAIFANVLSFTSEQQRLAYQDIAISPYSLFADLEGSETDLASAILRYKGVMLDSLIEDRLVAEASKENQDRDLLVNFRQTKDS